MEQKRRQPASGRHQAENDMTAYDPELLREILCGPPDPSDPKDAWYDYFDKAGVRTAEVNKDYL
jgi:hypothetical protein